MRVDMKWLQRFKKQPDTFDKRDLGILAGVLAVFGALSLGNMTRWSVWFDEAFGIYLIRFNYADVAKYTSTDVHPPFYYWLLKAWQGVFGGSELALRSLSMVALMGAIVFVYLLLRRAFSRGVATTAVSLMSISPMLLRYSEEARMYGLAALIVAAATYVLYSASIKSTRAKWITYGVLVSLGMWTHYFTAIMWLSHWVWRYVTTRQKTAKKTAHAFWTREWIWAHVLAVGLYLPWLPLMIKQMATVQGGGFWIPPIHADTPFNYLTNVLLYRENGQASGWLAVLMIAILTLVIVAVYRSQSRLKREQKPVYFMLATMSFVPVVLLLVMSLPPLRPAFIERYLIPSVPFLLALIGVALALWWQRSKKIATLLGGLLFIASISGISYLYQTGNFNKNANDPLPIKQTVRGAQLLAADGQPLLAATSWRFYESHYYDTERNPVYFEATDNLNWGSYDMLRYNTYRKIYDTPAFAREHGGKIWYIGDWKNGNVPLPKDGAWKVLREVEVDGLPDDRSAIRAAEIELVE